MTSINNDKCTIRAQINQTQGGHIQIRNINMNVNNTEAEISEDEFNFPRLIDTFHGREQEFTTLDKLFFGKKKSKIVLHGLPGYGKTELSKQYAQRCLKKKRVKHIFWIKAENEDVLNKLSVNLIKIYKKYNDVRCMFVFDNALNRRSVCDCEPSNNVKHKMLITSHVKEWGHGVVPLPLESLTSNSVQKIFKTVLEKNYRDDDNGLYIELGQIVDNVPLGIQIVAGYVRQRMNSLGQSFQLANCVEEMKQSKQKIIIDTFSKENSNPYKNSINGALTVSLNKIYEEEDIKRRKLAVILLYVCAFFDPERIRCVDLSRIPSIKELIGDTNNTTELKSAVRLLINFSFLDYCDNNEGYITIHRLIQSFLRHYLSLSNLEDKKCYSACVYSMFCFGSVLRYRDVGIAQECVEFFKKVFQDPNKIKREIIYEYDLLYKAAKLNRIEMLELLLQYANIKETNDNGHKVVYSVSRAWNVEAVDLLIDNGIHVNYRDAANKTPLDSLLSTVTSLEDFEYRYLLHKINRTLALLLERGASFNITSINEECEFWLLSSAVRTNKLDLLKSLLHQGFNVNSKNRSNTTVLHEAATGGNLEAIQTLISHGADVNAVNDWKDTVLFRYVSYVYYNRDIDKQKLCEILTVLNCQEQAQYSNISGGSLLHWAARKAYEELVTVLIETYHCDVNKQDDTGCTPLHDLILCLDKNSNKEEVVQTVQTLVRYGANLNIQNYRHQTPLKLLKWRSKLYGHNLKYLVQLLIPATDMKSKFRSCSVCL